MDSPSNMGFVFKEGGNWDYAFKLGKVQCYEVEDANTLLVVKT